MKLTKDEISTILWVLDEKVTKLEALLEDLPSFSDEEDQSIEEDRDKINSILSKLNRMKEET